MPPDRDTGALVWGSDNTFPPLRTTGVGQVLRPPSLRFSTETLFREQSPPPRPPPTETVAAAQTSLVGKRARLSRGQGLAPGSGPAGAELGGAGHVLVRGKITGFLLPLRLRPKCLLLRKTPRPVCLVCGGGVSPSPHGSFLCGGALSRLHPCACSFALVCLPRRKVGPVSGQPGLSPSCPLCVTSAWHTANELKTNRASR